MTSLEKNLNKNFSRNDYKELVKFPFVYLREKDENFTFKRPGV